MSEENKGLNESRDTAPESATAESILAFRNRPPIEHHDLPDGRRVYVYGLTDLEVQEWYADCGKTKDDEGREKVDDRFGDAKLLIRCIRDAEGRRLFTTAHLTQLVELPNFVKAPLVNKAMKLSAIGGKADAEILKNYARTLAGAC